MKNYRNIVESETAPDINDLWLKEDGLYKFGSNGWEKTEVTPEAPKVNDMGYMYERLYKAFNEGIEKSTHSLVSICTILRFKDYISKETELDSSGLSIPVSSLAINANYYKSYVFGDIGDSNENLHPDNLGNLYFISTSPQDEKGDKIYITSKVFEKYLEGSAPDARYTYPLMVSIPLDIERTRVKNIIPIGGLAGGMRGFVDLVEYSTGAILIGTSAEGAIYSPFTTSNFALVIVEK